MTANQTVQPGMNSKEKAIPDASNILKRRLPKAVCVRRWKNNVL